MISFSRIFYFGKITGGVLLDPGFSATKQYGVLCLPMAFILDREGIVRERVLGQVETQYFKKVVENLL
jgi:hypothetical protein